jgi:hypothetical protein
MPTIVSYRVYCSECDADAVIREDKVTESNWAVDGLHTHSGVCPECNDHLVEEDDVSDDELEVPFEELDNIGEKGASNIRESGILTRGDVKETSDEEFLAISWVGEKGVASIRREVR